MTMGVNAGILVDAIDAVVYAKSTTAQQQPEQQSEQQLGFDTISFPIQAIAGQIDMRAQGGWVWKEGNTHRIVLDHDVEVTLAQHQFQAAAANIWIRKLSPDESAGTSQYQVYAIFEDMRSADGTITLNAKLLPVRGVIEVSQPISIKLDAQFGEPPRSKSDVGRFVTRTDKLVAQRVLGASSPEAVQAAARPWSSSRV